MHAIVTCGPARTPIDAVRSITNFASGEIGTLLADALSNNGFSVLCLRGAGSTHPILPQNAQVRSFTTNQDLLQILHEVAPQADTFFHAAALSDFETHQITADGASIPPKIGKIRSNTSSLVIHLKPAPKILPLLRTLMPHAFIVGWKYEVEGTLETALEAGRQQVRSCQTNACIINGPAVNNQFCWLPTTYSPPNTSFTSKQQLADFLAKTALQIQNEK